ncbi:MAG: SUF system NifU family Fe-S cluster assembly protein [Candidatus Tectomicrobia bacterium]|uniref:SUF system NifU family Fe-S cluster assembly protein n=1 Tax=Tectimicrobiota bacterium TaxID=2528274 RepID=A0A933LQQ3_UNCTE|nr:SUF system NifU family Fe-S cluster assembly protein [Candidatus Tectomicrobia bacterium]
MMLNELYQEVILDHYRHPCNFGRLEEAEIVVSDTNPLCGDEIELSLSMNGEEVVKEAAFSGRGCAISQASASMMTEKIKGLGLKDIENLLAKFKAMMRGEEVKDQLGELEAFKGVLKFPVRIKCALLAWAILQKALLEYHARELEQIKPVLS